MCSPSLFIGLLSNLFLSFCKFLYPIEMVGPSLVDRSSVEHVGRNLSNGAMGKLDDGLTTLLAQAIQQMRYCRRRHKQRAMNLQKIVRADGLHMSPQVPGIVAEVAEPPSAGPRLDFHRQCLAFRSLVQRPEL